MNVSLTDSDRQALRQLQKQRRDEAGYVKVTVILLLDKQRPLASIADDLGLDDSTVYRYARAFSDLGLARYLAHEQPGYWGLLTSAQLAHLCQEVNATLYTDCKAIQHWLRRTYRVAYSLSGLTDLLHRLGFTYKLTTPVPCQADAAAQAGFLAELAVLEAQVERGEAVLYYADAAHPTHNTRCTRAWCAVGHERPLPTVSGRERPGAGQPERSPERPRAHAGTARRNRLRQCPEHPALVRAVAGGPPRQGPHLRRVRQRPLLQKQGAAGLAGRQAHLPGVSAALFAQPEPD